MLSQPSAVELSKERTIFWEQLPEEEEDTEEDDDYATYFDM